ncbi:MAG: disulfide bond formation protein B [Bdellovibrionales bacterium]|jgi:disulfide bond formation protein DsbB
MHSLARILSTRFLTLSVKESALLLFAASVGSLLTAYVAETFFGVLPCVLCLYQRVPYAVVVVLSLLAFVSTVLIRGRAARGLLLLCAFAFFVNAGIASFHSGVELHWWQGTDGCAVNPLVIQELKDPTAAREALMATPVVRCDAVNFTFLGFTMANWNILASLAFGAFALFAARRRKG